jgi:type II secretory pathway pseudopilin PulG
MSRLRRHCRPPRPIARGFVLLVFLLALALLGIATLAAADVWNVTRQREREEQLLWVGDQYRTAIRHYFYGGPPGAGRALPTSLEALLDDDRFPIPVHHLRRLYPDPVTGSSEWGLMQVGDGIIGVYSRSEAQPLKLAGFGQSDLAFADKTSYRDWVFAFVPGRRSGTVATGPVTARPSPLPNIPPSSGNPP